MVHLDDASERNDKKISKSCCWKINDINNWMSAAKVNVILLLYLKAIEANYSYL
jgi:hypothetical protein